MTTITKSWEEEGKYQISAIKDFLEVRINLEVGTMITEDVDTFIYHLQCAREFAEGIEDAPVEGAF